MKVTKKTNRIPTRVKNTAFDAVRDLSIIPTVCVVSFRCSRTHFSLVREQTGDMPESAHKQ